MGYNKYESLHRWGILKTKLHDKFSRNNLTQWKVSRGTIYGCYLGENIGFEKSGIDSRPVLVVSSDLVNKNSGNVIIIPLSKEIKWDKRYDSQNRKLRYDWHYVLYRNKYNKLKYDSAVQSEDIRVVSKSRLGDFICKVKAEDMKNISKRIKKSLQV